MPSVKSNDDSIETTDPEAFKQMLKEFRKTMQQKCKPLPEEPDYFTSDLILTDFLRARKYNLSNAVDMLTEAVEWRRTFRPLSTDCTYCHENPGYHCIREIGHDKFGRPILYACFAQANTTKNRSEDTIMHCVEMLENVRRSFQKNATQLVMIIDCTGMTLPCCNPNLGKKVMHVFADYYPERLGRAVIVNYKSVFKRIWSAIKTFLDPVTASKIVFLKTKKKVTSKSKTKMLGEGLREFCDEETAKWLEDEIMLNKDINETQMRFWEKPSGNVHDPRGTDAYIRDYIDCPSPPNGFKPHPNIVDIQTGKLKKGYAVKIRGSQAEKIDSKAMEEYGIDANASIEDDSD
ncbi:unnamed protein product [Hymenolepis diminuta]|uniref:CRAL-TRIO domain-containing protein n=1 Tax=Hymenolepis diminuta TaxID=6216 RepID=A0A0R3SEL4_HYMDI|nr:unnamed protein product [Hymenolepis diminuta]VUZ55158.1 unnamed protein product [Hymenolepis diminuta]